ncbi:myosin-binding protein 2-like [Iris pallida]|uniref:Myosin-binding protein 2-like n=1 Tax=Iris pallida TaxID=29817 RepID=A0AAX6HJB4_IRIPA|nr:myosin-binding protein 2-like [Iris pallida]
MAASSNKFATMLHDSNTPKIAIVLIYTLLEWILLALLLLDGLFSYSIAAFADFFGLDPPCFLCSHALGRNSASSYREILCDSHADEIAGLAYCSRHRNLASASRMCEDCSSSKPLSWAKKTDEEEEEEGVRCSCCSEALESGFYSPVPFIFADKFQERSFLDGKLTPNEKDGVRSSANGAVEEGASVVELKLEDGLEKKKKVEESNIDDSAAAAVVVVPASCEEEEVDCAISIGDEICDQEEALINETMVKEPSNEVEEERVPETPTSFDSFHASPKTFMFERREFGMESLDHEVDGSDDVLTVDRLKEALRAERKALSSLYLELEEERSASAIAANQTIAMITRLQEEKAAVQMEAVQYQRMMEEQSEYDQEALQLLNELMMKREKELEAYRKKVLDYEAKERRRGMAAARTSRRSHNSSGSLSADESNELSSEDCDYIHNDDDLGSFGAAKHLLTLDDSLADFEEERFSILEQLKALEEKLFSLDDDDDDDHHHHSPELDGEYDYESSGSEDLNNVNGTSSNGSEAINGKLINQQKLAIAEEVDHVYERLQALEADREFIKHCLDSLKKGDKGMDLLQEILQHLRDLRSVQLRATTTTTTTAEATHSPPHQPKSA